MDICLHITVRTDNGEKWNIIPKEVKDVRKQMYNTAPQDAVLPITVDLEIRLQLLSIAEIRYRQSSIPEAYWQI